MSMSLDRLRRMGGQNRDELDDGAFEILRTADADARAFDSLVRETVDSSGRDFVALPRRDGRAGYDGVFIIPLI